MSSYPRLVQSFKQYSSQGIAKNRHAELKQMETRSANDKGSRMLRT